MLNYAYRAIDRDGNGVAGTLAAVDEQSLAEKLQTIGYWLVEAKTCKPDEVREFPKGRVELLQVGGVSIGRATFEPGWKWSTSVMPLAKTKSCEAPHFQYHVSGTLKVVMDDGQEFTCISTPTADVKAFVIATNEEWMIARHTANCLRPHHKKAATD